MKTIELKCEKCKKKFKFPVYLIADFDTRRKCPVCGEMTPIPAFWKVTV